jgi:integrase
MLLKHTQARGGRTVYRRRITKDELKRVLGKGEIVLPLGRTDAEVRRNYDSIHTKVEAILATAWDEARGIKRPPQSPTARELFQQATTRMQELLGTNPYRDNQGGVDDVDDWVARSVITDEIARRYREDPETGLPIGVSREDTELVRVLMSDAPRQPPVTVEDAKRRYLDDKFALIEPGPLERKKHEQRAERAIGFITKALGRVPTVVSIKREEARRVQAFMREQVLSKATVDRYLNDVRAIIHHAIAEFDELHGTINQFTGLPDLAGGRNGGVLPQEEARALSAAEFEKISHRIQTKTRRQDIKLIWRMLAGTGCRLSEVAGLRTADVFVDGDMPYAHAEWREERRLKNVTSRRMVPLIGDALEAARQALELASGGKMLFPAYGREGGGSAASAALMKHVRAITDDPKAMVKSLRRNMKETLMRAGVDLHGQNLILGHALGGEGARYGGPHARLEVATREMKKASSCSSSRVARTDGETGD